MKALVFAVLAICLFSETVIAKEAVVREPGKPLVYHEDASGKSQPLEPGTWYLVVNGDFRQALATTGEAQCNEAKAKIRSGLCRQGKDLSQLPDR